MSEITDPVLARPGASRGASAVTIVLTGHLDAHAGVELLAGLQAELEPSVTRIDIDLLGLTGWTPEGARALRRAHSLSSRLTDGLHFRTGPGAGHDALLEAYGADEAAESG